MSQTKTMPRWSRTEKGTLRKTMNAAVDYESGIIAAEAALPGRTAQAVKAKWAEMKAKPSAKKYITKKTMQGGSFVHPMSELVKNIQLTPTSTVTASATEVIIKF